MLVPLSVFSIFIILILFLAGSRELRRYFSELSAIKVNKFTKYCKLDTSLSCVRRSATTYRSVLKHGGSKQTCVKILGLERGISTVEKKNSGRSFRS